MAQFLLSAFADEYSASFDEQIKGLLENGIKFMEIRGVNGKSIADVTPDEAKELKAKLDANGLAVSSMGSPIGKIPLDGDFDAHLESLRRITELAHIFDCDRIRLFSFYIPEGRTPFSCRGEVMEKMGKMLDVAISENIFICHENERGIYGETSERCLDIQRWFSGEIKCIFDHANFICCGDEPYPKAFEMLREHIFYLHIKDADAEKHMTPAGMGIGRIPETINSLRALDKTFVLTVEPHLQVFKGIENLQNQSETAGKVVNHYRSSAEAFKAACDAIKSIIE